MLWIWEKNTLFNTQYCVVEHGNRPTLCLVRGKFEGKLEQKKIEEKNRKKEKVKEKKFNRFFF